MSLEKKMSHIEAQDKLIASLRIENDKLKKDFHNMKKMYMNKVEKLEGAFDMEYKRAELLQYDLDRADDFITEVCEAYSLKYSRKPS